MLLMVVPGMIAVVFGVLFLCAPQWLPKTKPPADRRGWMALDPFLLAHRIPAGICFLAIGIFCLSSACYVWVRLHS